MKLILSEPIPVLSASLSCMFTKNSFPPFAIFLNWSNSSCTPAAITPPLLMSTAGFSCISLLMRVCMASHASNWFDNLPSHWLGLWFNRAFTMAVCSNPLANCTTSLGPIFLKAILLTNLSISPHALMAADNCCLSSVCTMQNSTASNLSSIACLFFNGNTNHLFNSLAPMALTVLSITCNKEVWPSDCMGSNSKLRIVNRSIHKNWSRSMRCICVICCRFGCSVSFK